MRKRIELLFVLLAIPILFGALTLFFWDFVRDTLVIPLYYAIWVGGLFMKSIPEAAWLGLLVGICLWTGLTALGNLRGEAVPQRSQDRMLSGSSRYRSWLKLSRGSNTSELARRAMRLEVRQLVLAVFAFQEGVDSAEAEQMVASERVVVPEGVRRLIVSKDVSAPGPGVKRMGPIAWIVDRWLRRPAMPTIPILENEIGDSIEFLEARLEMPHE